MKLSIVLKIMNRSYHVQPLKLAFVATLAVYVSGCCIAVPRAQMDNYAELDGTWREFVSSMIGGRVCSSPTLIRGNAVKWDVDPARLLKVLGE